MKVSYNWIQEYLDFKLPPAEELVAKIGSQLGAVESIEDLGAKYHGIVAVHVVACRPLEASNHLSVCLVDDGQVTPDVERNAEGFVQVVCGAPNVRVGITVPWLPPGSTVPSTFHNDRFILGARELRGVTSNGMLASAKELALGDSHEGILELDEACAAGDSFANLYELNDFIIDIENKMFTHRPDCFGLLGVAREISGIYGKAFHEPDWYALLAPAAISAANELSLVVRNETPEYVPRFMAVAVSNVTVQPSTLKLQAYLTRIGIRPINNIVDITNYCMYLTGQPLHAYDYNKVQSVDNSGPATLVARLARPGEKLTLLSGKDIEPREGAIVIATETQVIGLAGVMGGASTEVDQNTTAIIIESATFEMYSIRRTSMTHGIFSEAVTRFNKGQSPFQNDRVLQLAISQLALYCEAQTVGQIFDERSSEVQIDGAHAATVMVDVAFINSRLGSDLTADYISEILTNVGFSIITDNNEDNQSLNITLPFWRTDIAIAEDIVEEVGRLHGFDNLQTELPQRSLRPAVKNVALEFKSQLRRNLSRAGANEVLTYSFTNKKLFKAAGQNSDLAYALTNALSPELQFYRLSLTPSLLEKATANLRAGYGTFALFEIGKAHVHVTSENETSGVPAEYERLSLIIVSDAKSAKAFAGAPYYEAKKYLSNVMQSLGLSDTITYTPLGSETGDAVIAQRTSVYIANRSARIMVGAICIGEIGEYTASARQSLKLPEFCAGFELELTELMRASSTTGHKYQSLPKFPKVEQDICLKVASDVTYAQVVAITQIHLANLGDDFLTSVSPVDIYQTPDDTGFKQITLRIAVASYVKTLTDDEISQLLTRISQTAHTELQAIRV